MAERRRGFEELPENTFDRSDRKFLVVAVAAKTVVVNARDGDKESAGRRAAQLEVDVEELCPHLPWINGASAGGRA